MLEKKFVILFAVINLAAFIGLFIWYVKADREPPVITVKEEIVYTKETNNEDILECASAWDEQDGDVSESLVIEKIIPNEELKTALVSCGALDKSGNITKHSFRIPCDISVFSNEEGKVFELAVGEAVNMLGDTVGEAEAESDTTGTETEEETTEAASEEETTEEESAEIGLEEDAEEDAEEQEAAETADEGEQSQQEQSVRPNPEQADTKPVLVFSAPEVKTSPGYNPAWVTVIAQLKDDTDSYEQLLKTLKIAGDFDNKTPGSYDVSVTVTDSEGNESAPRAMRIIVE